MKTCYSHKTTTTHKNNRFAVSK